MKFICKHKKLMVCMVMISSIFSLTCTAAALDDPGGYIDSLGHHKMPQHNIISYCGRFVGWLIVRFLRWIVNALQKASSSINDNFNKIFSNDGVTDLIKQVKLISIALFVIVLAYIGFEYLFKKDQNKNFNTYVMNFVIGVIVALGISTAITDLYDISSKAIRYLQDGKSLADTITANNISDNLLFFDKDGKYAPPPEDKKSKLDFETIDKETGKSSLDNVDINEWIPKNQGAPYDKYLSVDETGESTVKDIDEGPGIAAWHMNMLGNLYYRWSVNWFEVIVELTIMAFALAIMCIKIARLCYEMVVHQMMAQALAFLDIHSGQRLKKCLQSLIATFVTFFGCFLLLQLYIAGNSFIHDQGFNTLTKIICMLALAISVLDGPNLFEQIIGVDAGLNSTTAAILSAHGIMGGMRALGKGAKGLARGASTAVSGAKKAANVAGKATGAAAGVMAGKKSAQSGMNPLPFHKSPGEAEDGDAAKGDESSSKNAGGNEDIQQSKEGAAKANKDSKSAEKVQKGANQHMPKTIGDHVKNYAKNKVMGENTPGGHAKRTYNLTKEAALHSAAKKDYINTRASELDNQNIFSTSRAQRQAKKDHKIQAKKDYKTNMDKHFGG